MSEEITKTGLDPDDKQTAETPRRGPLDDAIPNGDDPDPRANRGQPPEKVEDRPNVGTVTPEDYPRTDRARGA